MVKNDIIWTQFIHLHCHQDTLSRTRCVQISSECRKVTLNHFQTSHQIIWTPSQNNTKLLKTLFERCRSCVSIWTQENCTQGYVRQILDIEILLLTLFRHMSTFATHFLDVRILLPNNFRTHEHFGETFFGHLDIFVKYFSDTCFPFWCYLYKFQTVFQRKAGSLQGCWKYNNR